MDEDRILAAFAETRREQRLEMAELRTTMTAALADLRTELKSELAELSAESRPAQIGGFHADTMDRFDRVENRLTEIRDDITVAMGAGTTALHQQREGRAEVLDLIETMTVIHRQVRRLRTDMDEIKKAS